eukprot:TRINITY_DN8027_c0_g1_i1.p2 TRINITY_DN8027_c0_g1~~TRINITY_DN8027_c0_g1_i1.p2  ORF type:complete len:55 (+),score=2.20 TRINITY_DN8027_c0_g1_i1:363-527(+)
MLGVARFLTQFSLLFLRFNSSCQFSWFLEFLTNRLRGLFVASVDVLGKLATRRQ